MNGVVAWLLPFQVMEMICCISCFGWHWPTAFFVVLLHALTLLGCWTTSILYTRKSITFLRLPYQQKPWSEVCECDISRMLWWNYLDLAQRSTWTQEWPDYILVVKGHFVFYMYYHDPRKTTCCVHRCVILLLSSTVLYVLLHVQNPPLKHLGTLCIGWSSPIKLSA